MENLQKMQNVLAKYDGFCYDTYVMDFFIRSNEC